MASRSVRVESGAVSIVVVGDADFVLQALPSATTRLHALELALRLDSTIIVHDDVFAFVAATGQTTPTLRAWSTLQTIHLLPPSTWADPTPPAADKRLAHELCHLALWQSQQTPGRALPRFVTEGVCSVAADQGSNRQPLPQVLELVRSGRTVDFNDDASFSYGLAHHVFAAVLRCRGRAGLQAVVDAVAGGATVAQALGADPRHLLEQPCPAAPDVLEPTRETTEADAHQHTRVSL